MYLELSLYNLFFPLRGISFLASPVFLFLYFSLTLFDANGCVLASIFCLQDVGLLTKHNEELNLLSVQVRDNVLLHKRKEMILHWLPSV